MLEGKGHCEHGEFELRDGCPQCMAERKAEAEVNSPENVAKRIAAVQPQPIIVKVRFFSESSNEYRDTEYAYFSKEPLKVGDIVMEPVRGGTASKAMVSTIGVNEGDIAAFKDKVKTIPAASILQAELRPEQEEMEEPVEIVGEILQQPDAESPPLVTTAIKKPAGETAVALRPGEDIEAHDCFLEAQKLLDIAKSRAITTLEESKAANNDLALISKLTKLMDGKMKALLAPHKLETDAIRGTYKYLMAPILEANSITKNKMLAFDTKQRQIQAEQERINQQRLAAAQAEMNLKGELSESVNLVEVEKAPERVRTDMGTSFKTDRWKYKIDDINQLPREYMLPDDAQLSAIAKKHHDKKPVPGVTFYNDPYYKVRTK